MPQQHSKKFDSHQGGNQLKQALENVGFKQTQSTQPTKHQSAHSLPYKSHKQAQPMKKHEQQEINFSQQAAFAIAVNLAESRVKSVFTPQQAKAYSSKDGVIGHLSSKMDATQGSRPLPEDIPYATELLNLWNRITMQLPDKRQRYKTDYTRQLDMADLLIALNCLRNYFSHMSRMGDPFDLSAQPHLCGFLKTLFDEAATRLNVRSTVSLFDGASTHEQARGPESRLNQLWGSAFLINLFLPRSQAERLMQYLPELKRRERRVFTYYSARDGYSLTQLDSKGSLFREIIGYLCLPPLDSAAGQQALLQWQQQLAKLPPGELPADSARLRKHDKVRTYLLQTLDALNLLPELQFWGHYQVRECLPHEDDFDVLSDTPELTEMWVNEPSPHPVQQKHVDPKHPNATLRDKNTRHEAYARNTGLSPQRRFVYDMADGNIRFQLLEPKNPDLPAVCGVMRLRDFISLGYMALAHKEQCPQILDFMRHWLRKYQARLQALAKPVPSMPNEASDDDKLYFDHYPQQIQRAMGPQLEQTDPSLSLKQRLHARIQARLKRIDLLLERDRTPVRAQDAVYKHHLPLHEQVHEILHDFIANLNKEGRAKVTRHEFVRLQKMLLQYKGQSSRDEILYIKSLAAPQAGALPAAKVPSSLSNKGLFWQYIHQKYTSELVNGNKTHPIWAHAVSASKRGERQGREGVASLGALCVGVLKSQQKHMLTLEKECRQANEDDLKQMAVELQLSLQAPARPEAKVPDSGLQASAHNVLHYSVLPAAFVQQALEMHTDAPETIGNSAHETRYTSLAQQIRSYPTQLKLLPDYYSPTLRYPQWGQKLQAAQRSGENQPLSVLSAPEKKQWKQAVKALNDWHTHDQLCLMMAECLAAPANIHLEQGAQVHDMAAQQPTLDIEGKSPCGGLRTLKLQLSSTHQGTRLWMAWPLPKLEYALCLHYADGACIESKKLPTVIARYQSHYHQVVKVILHFEHTFYKLRPAHFIELKQEQAQKKKNYIPFTRLANSAGLKDWGGFNKEVVIDSLEHLRNIALHDGLPGRDCPYKNPDEIRKCLLPQQQTIGIDDIGCGLLELLKNHKIPPKK